MVQYIEVVFHLHHARLPLLGSCYFYCKIKFLFFSFSFVQTNVYVCIIRRIKHKNVTVYKLCFCMYVKNDSLICASNKTESVASVTSSIQRGTFVTASVVLARHCMNHNTYPLKFHHIIHHIIISPKHAFM